jgi:hypothetical protein
VVNLRLGDPESALLPLKKLHSLLPDQPEVRGCGWEIEGHIASLARCCQQSVICKARVTMLRGPSLGLCCGAGQCAGHHHACLLQQA